MKAWNSTLSPRRAKPRRVRSETPQGDGAGILHPGPFRSEELRELAAKVPHCMRCGKRNELDIVGCHSNSLSLGKGMGLKAADLLAYACPLCHRVFDGEEPGYTAEERELEWLRAMARSEVWRLSEGYLVVRAA